MHVELAHAFVYFGSCCFLEVKGYTCCMYYLSLLITYLRWFEKKKLSLGCNMRQVRGEANMYGSGKLRPTMSSLLGCTSVCIFFPIQYN